jgi:hypothetical protein
MTDTEYVVVIEEGMAAGYFLNKKLADAFAASAKLLGSEHASVHRAVDVAGEIATSAPNAVLCHLAGRLPQIPSTVMTYVESRDGKTLYLRRRIPNRRAVQHLTERGFILIEPVAS